MNSRPLIGIPLIPRNEPDESSGAVQCGWRKYAAAIHAAGGLPVFLPVLPDAEAAIFVKGLSGLLLPGGGDVDPELFGEARHPATRRVIRALDDFEIALARLASDAGLPIFGICRGAQVLNVALGGTLIQDIPAQVPGAIRHGDNPIAAPIHAVDVRPDTRLACILGAGTHTVNSTHHQSLKDLAPRLRASAVCPDDGIIEAIEDPDARFCIGVQFHPEEMMDRFHALFTAFVKACEGRPGR